MKKKWTDEQLVEAVKDSYSIYQVLEKIGLKLSGGTHALVKLRIRQLGLDKSHFTGRGWCKGEKHKELVRKFTKPLSEVLVRDSTYQNTNALKLRLIREGLLLQKCYKCGLTDWMGEPISLQLHHMDGDRCNNLITNLTILCPNCHSQTSSFAGRAKKKG